MIGKLTGQFGGMALEDSVVVDVAGVGYVVRVSQTTRDKLRPASPFADAAALSLFIHTAVREDAIDLYGFPTENELLFFKQLMSVSGIGPKTALGIFDKAEVSGLERAIRAGDMVALTSAFGIGKKLAERLVLELRDKIKTGAAPAPAEHGQGSDAEVIEALMALGYSAAESRAALKTTSHTGAVHERLAQALKNV